MGPGIPSADDVRIDNTTARYGNWVGEGWWGGSEMPDKVGALPPIDALDALGQAHDMAYEIAEEAGKINGDAERYRLRKIADAIGYLAFQNLPQDPRDWVPPPSDLEKAAIYRDRFPITMKGLIAKNAKDEYLASKPTPEQAAALEKAGKLGPAELNAAAQARVQAWNKDRGQSMRMKPK